jgi:hypothetical protein
VPCHPLPEEALVGLYELFREQPLLKTKVSLPVNETNYLSLAEFWIENPGNNIGEPDWEKNSHQWSSSECTSLAEWVHMPTRKSSGQHYALPNDAYLETCAAVGAGFFHRNMNLAFDNNGLNSKVRFLFLKKPRLVVVHDLHLDLAADNLE